MLKRRKHVKEKWKIRGEEMTARKKENRKEIGKTRAGRRKGEKKSI